MSQEEIEAAIETNLKGPKRVRVGNQEVEQHSIADQMAAVDRNAGKTAVTRNDLGLRRRQITPYYP